MVFDRRRDADRWRAILLVLTSMLVLLLVVAGWRELRPEWKRRQVELAPERAPEIIEIEPACGETSRCMTCHLQPHQSLGVVSEDMLASHPVGRFSCQLCHGGTGRALNAEAAHAVAGGRQPDAAMRMPWMQGSCAGCHVPGQVVGTERAVRGARLYLALGCTMCHPLTPGGRGGWDFGPDLRSIVRRAVPDLRQSVINPTASFSDSTMPSYQRTFANDRDALNDLVIFLRALGSRPALGCRPTDRGGAFANEPCRVCHTSGDEPKTGALRHRCSYIVGRRDELDCARCHPSEIPQAGTAEGFCPLVAEHRGACAACHRSIGSR